MMIEPYLARFLGGIRVKLDDTSRQLPAQDHPRGFCSAPIPAH
ncbi:hypothetical protein J2W94_003536 [Pseudoxanthomonas sacheonensis]|uniref:Uncharacterized protein n=1 Tax=Pseudoxanthomonas sacheonensis TaxID=443615 RepID=A0ABU1RWR7_9GAMM|nr:hypothetical protein [Pseudoxanthomonas sacheonensis]